MLQTYVVNMDRSTVASTKSDTNGFTVSPNQKNTPMHDKNAAKKDDHLIQVHKYKLKGNEPLSSCLACNFGNDSDGTCFYQPKKYISKILGAFRHMFPGETLKKQSRPIIKGDRPELDDSEFVSEEEKAKNMSMVGTPQWLATLRRFAIAIAVSMLSSYRAAS